MELKKPVEDSQRKARCIARVWATWLRRQGRPVDRGRCRELEAEVAALLAKYQEEWGVSLVGLRFDPPRSAAETPAAGPSRFQAECSVRRS